MRDALGLIIAVQVLGWLRESRIGAAAHNDPIFGSDAERSHLDTWTITRFGVSFPIRSMTSTPITMTPR